MIQKNNLFIEINSNYINQHDFYYNASPTLGTDLLVMNEEKRREYLNLLDSLINRPKNINLGNIVYTGKLCNIPRHKLKEYLNVNNIKRTSKIETASTFIVDKSNFLRVKDYLTENYQFSEGREQYYVSGDDVKNNDVIKTAIKDYVKNSHTYRNKDYVNNFLTRWDVFKNDNERNIVIRIDEDDILDTRRTNDGLIKIIYEECKKIGLIKSYVNIKYSNSIDFEVIEFLDYLISHPNLNIIFDNDILETLNSDGIELDEEYLQTLNNMFTSGDSDNIKLAVEMLNHVNIEKDALKIALLLNKYQNFLNNQYINTSSTSFKTIRKYYESKRIDWKSYWVGFAKDLYSNYKDNEEDKKVIESFIKDNLNNVMMNNFAIKEFDLEFKG